MATSFDLRNVCPKFSSPMASAIYLNNVAVSLMERFCYQEALETFYNALGICHDTTAPSQAMIEHNVYRAYLRLSSITDDGDYDDKANQRCSTLGKKVTMPILYDQLGNNISVSQLREDHQWKGCNITLSPFDRLKDDLGHLEYFLIYFQPNHKYGPMESASMLLATILLNYGQAHLLIGNQQCGVYDPYCPYVAIASQLFLKANQTLKSGIPRKESPPRYPAHNRGGLAVTAEKKESWPEAVSTTSQHKTDLNRRQPRFKSNPAA